MHFIPRPKPVDKSRYSPVVDSPDVYYGLPSAVTYCTRCVYSNQKPLSMRESSHTKDSKKESMVFDEEGVCAACRAIEAKRGIDWKEREKELVELCDAYRSEDGRYDCVVPGSGGKDSFFAAHVLKYKYGMHPLTVTWSPHLYTDWGWKNFQYWIDAGFDNYLFTPNGKVHRLLTRLALDRILHPFQPFILGQYYFPPTIAARLGIPLVFYGEPPSDYGSSVSSMGKAQKEYKYFSESDPSDIFISGTSVHDLKTHFGLTAGDLKPFMPCDPQLLMDAKIDVRYLGYYIPWHPQSNYYYSVENGKFKAAPERTAGTYSRYSSIDDKIDDLHYYTTFIKFGMGRTIYDAAQEVRFGDLTREEAMHLVRKYDGEYSTRFEKDNFEYLSIPENEFPVASKMFENPIMDKDYFRDLIDNHRSPHLWKWENGEWKLRYPIWDIPNT